jgi:hypothetical protein
LLWCISANIDVPNDIDKIVGELSRMGWCNARAATASCIAAALGALDLVVGALARASTMR